jgi:hypothetical protein
MARVGLLNRVDAERADGVYGEHVERGSADSATSSRQQTIGRWG